MSHSTFFFLIQPKLHLGFKKKNKVKKRTKKMKLRDWIDRLDPVALRIATTLLLLFYAF